MNYFLFILAIALCAAPLDVFAQATNVPLVISDPLGGGSNILALLDRLLGWAFAISIPIAVFVIVYAGLQFLLARGDSTKIGSARKMLWYAVIGLAIIFIGRGFVSLINSILSLGQP